MLSRKVVTLLCLTALTGLGGYALLSQPVAQSRPFGQTLVPHTLRIIDRDFDQALVVTTPTQAQLDQLSTLLTANPQLSQQPRVFERVFQVEAFRLLEDGTQQSLPRQDLRLSWADPLTGDSQHVELLSINTPQGNVLLDHPGALGFPLLNNPVQPSLAVMEQNHMLLLVDGQTEKVTPLGDMRARATLLAQARSMSNVSSDGHPHVAVQWASLPVWSPNGQQLAFLSNRETALGALEVWLHHLQTGQEQKLYSPGELPIRLLDFEADDKLLVQVYDTTPTGQEKLTLGRILLQTGTFEPLAEGDFMHLSGDRKELLYMTGKGDGLTLRLLNLRTGTQDALWSAHAQEYPRSYQATMSEDGRLIALDVTDPEARQRIWVHDRELQESRYLSLPAEQQLSGSVQFVGHTLLVPLENLRTRSTQSWLVTF